MFLFVLCLSAGSSDCAVQELAHGCHRDEWGKYLRAWTSPVNKAFKVGDLYRQNFE